MSGCCSKGFRRLVLGRGIGLGLDHYLHHRRRHPSFVHPHYRNCRLETLLSTFHQWLANATKQERLTRDIAVIIIVR